MKTQKPQIVPVRTALILIVLALIIVGARLHAQVVTIQNPLPEMPSFVPVTNTTTTTTVTVYTPSNPPTAQDGLNILFASFKTTNAWWAAYGIRYDGDPQSVSYKGKTYQVVNQKKIGFGIGVFVPQGKYLDLGARVDWIDGGLWMPTVNASLGYPITFSLPFASTNWSVTVKPVIETGVAIALSGSSLKLGGTSVTIPGNAGTGQPVAITGAGGVVKIYSKGSFSLYAAFMTELWTGFHGMQQRAGLVAHF